MTCPESYGCLLATLTWNFQNQLATCINLFLGLEHGPGHRRRKFWELWLPEGHAQALLGNTTSATSRQRQASFFQFEHNSLTSLQKYPFVISLPYHNFLFVCFVYIFHIGSRSDIFKPHTDLYYV